MIPLVLGNFRADAQAAGLIVGAVGSGGHFSVLPAFTASRHPGFEIKFAIRGTAEVTCGRVDDAIRDPQCLKDLFFDLDDFLMDRVRRLERWCSKGEDFDLRKLMDAVNTA